VRGNAADQATGRSAVLQLKFAIYRFGSLVACVLDLVLGFADSGLAFAFQLLGCSFIYSSCSSALDVRETSPRVLNVRLRAVLGCAAPVALQPSRHKQKSLRQRGTPLMRARSGWGRQRKDALKWAVHQTR
jgi:hypothetical protein